MQIIFLGTGSMIPTIQRNHISTLLRYKNEGIMIDCGEGTQRQLSFARISPTKITKLLITHWHGDHILGIPGLIQSLARNQYNKVLEIYGPKNTQKYFTNLFKSFETRVEINYKIKEISSGIFFGNQDFYLEAKKLIHTVPCLGYSFVEKDKRNINLKYLKKFKLQKHPILKELQQGRDISWKGQKIKASLTTKIKKGKKITFVSDTNYCDNAISLAKNSDILICEATHLDELKEKTEQYKHLTSKQSALIAKKANVKELILTHFSQRYKDVDILRKEASSIFKNTIIAKDLMKVDV